MGLEDDLVIKPVTISEENFIEHMLSGFMIGDSTLDGKVLEHLINRAADFRKSYGAPKGGNLLNYIFLPPKEVELIKELLRPGHNKPFKFLRPSPEVIGRLDETYRLNAERLQELVRQVLNLAPRQPDQLAIDSVHLTSESEKIRYIFQFLAENQGRFNDDKLDKAIRELKTSFDPNSYEDQGTRSRINMNFYPISSLNHPVADSVIVRLKSLSFAYKIARKLTDLEILLSQYESRRADYVNKMLELLKLGAMAPRNKAEKRDIAKKTRGMREILKQRLLIPLKYLLVMDFHGITIVGKGEEIPSTEKIPYLKGKTVVRGSHPYEEKDKVSKSKKELHQTQLTILDRGRFVDFHFMSPWGLFLEVFGPVAHIRYAGHTENSYSRGKKRPKRLQASRRRITSGDFYEAMKNQIYGLFKGITIPPVEEPIFRHRTLSLEKKLRILEIERQRLARLNPYFEYEIGTKKVKRLKVDVRNQYDRLLKHYYSALEDLVATHMDSIFIMQYSRVGDNKLLLLPEIQDFRRTLDEFLTDYETKFGHLPEDTSQNFSDTMNSLRYLATVAHSILLSADNLGESETHDKYIGFRRAYTIILRQIEAKVSKPEDERLVPRLYELHFYYDLQLLKSNVAILEKLSEGGVSWNAHDVRELLATTIHNRDRTQKRLESLESRGYFSVHSIKEYLTLVQKFNEVAASLSKYAK